MKTRHPPLHKTISINGLVLLDYDNALIYLGKEAIDMGKYRIYRGENKRTWTPRMKIQGLAVIRYGSTYLLLGDRTLITSTDNGKGMFSYRRRLFKASITNLVFSLTNGYRIEVECLFHHSDSPIFI